MSERREWWSTFFSGAALRCWRQAVPEESTRAEVEFIVESLGLEPGQHVLDVPCGNGRHALALAQRDIRVTGVDLCAEFIEEARAAAAADKLRARFEVRDMRDLPWSEAFDAAICFGNSFGYLSHDENANFLHAVAGCLGRGGGLLLQTAAVAESALPNLAETDEHATGDIVLRSRSRYDALRGVMQVEYRFHENGDDDPVEVKHAEYSIQTTRRLCETLRDAGFAEIEIQGDMEDGAYEVGSPCLYLMARKA